MPDKYDKQVYHASSHHTRNGPDESTGHTYLAVSHNTRDRDYVDDDVRRRSDDDDHIDDDKDEFDDANTNASLHK